MLAAISFCHMLNDMMQSLLPAIYPILKDNHGLTFGQIGLLTFTFQVTASLLQPAFGRVVLFFGYVRQGLLVLPFWLTFTAAAGTAVARRLAHRGDRDRGWKLLPLEESEPSPRLLKVLGGLAVALLVLELWGAGRDRNFKAVGSTLQGSNVIIPDEPVRLEPLPPQP